MCGCLENPETSRAKASFLSIQLIPFPLLLAPVETIVLHWNSYSYDALEERLEAEKFSFERLPNRPRFSAYLQGKTLSVHPSLRCANHGVASLPRQCVRFIQDLVEHYKPERLFALQTGGALKGEAVKINSVYRITQIQFQETCLPVKRVGVEGPPPAMMLYSLDWVSSGLGAPLCRQRPALLSSNSLSIPWLQREGLIDSLKRVEILIAVTDFDGSDAMKSRLDYKMNRKKAAEILVSLLWEQLDL